MSVTSAEHAAYCRTSHVGGLPDDDAKETLERRAAAVATAAFSSMSRLSAAAPIVGPSCTISAKMQQQYRAEITRNAAQPWVREQFATVLHRHLAEPGLVDSKFSTDASRNSSNIWIHHTGNGKTVKVCCSEVEGGSKGKGIIETEFLDVSAQCASKEQTLLKMLCCQIFSSLLISIRPDSVISNTKVLDLIIEIDDSKIVWKGLFSATIYDDSAEEALASYKVPFQIELIKTDNTWEVASNLKLERITFSSPNSLSSGKK